MNRAQPCLAISCGLLVSTTQCVCSPLSPFASNFRKQCGLAHSHSVTLPDTVTVLSLSYDAFPWCANSTVEMHKLIVTAKIIASLCLMLDPLVDGLWTIHSTWRCGDHLDVPGPSLVTRNQSAVRRGRVGTIEGAGYPRQFEGSTSNTIVPSFCRDQPSLPVSAHHAPHKVNRV